MKWLTRASAILVFSTCAASFPSISIAQYRNIELDTLSIEQIQYYLNAELDDIYIEYDESENYDVNLIFDIIMEALSDRGDYINDQDENDDGTIDDDNDEGEQIITSANLASEMSEAGVSLENVVWQSLQISDRYSRNNNSEIMTIQESTDRTANLPRSKLDVSNRLTREITKVKVQSQQGPPSQYPRRQSPPSQYPQ